MLQFEPGGRAGWWWGVEKRWTAKQCLEHPWFTYEACSVCWNSFGGKKHRMAKMTLNSRTNWETNAIDPCDALHLYNLNPSDHTDELDPSSSSSWQRTEERTSARFRITEEEDVTSIVIVAIWIRCNSKWGENEIVLPHSDSSWRTLEAHSSSCSTSPSGSTWGQTSFAFSASAQRVSAYVYAGEKGAL